MLNLAGCSHFARHYFGNLGWFLFLQLLRCFSSPRSLCIPMYSVCNDLKGRVSPFGNLRIKACLLAPRSLSQATTSFIACNRQGIHHVHLFTCPYNVSLWHRHSSFTCRTGTREAVIDSCELYFTTCLPYFLRSFLDGVHEFRTFDLIQSQPINTSWRTSNSACALLLVSSICIDKIFTSSRLLKNETANDRKRSNLIYLPCVR